MSYNVPRVQQKSVEEDVRLFTQNPTFTVPIYKGYTTDGERNVTCETQFIYTGEKGNKSETQKKYIRFSDLEDRLMKGCGDIYNDDWENVTKKTKPFPVWHAKGNKLDTDDTNKFLFATTNSKHGKRLPEFQFQIFCGTST